MAGLNVLVTGGTGYLGTWICERLTSSGHRATPLSSSDCDVSNREACLNYFAGADFDAAVHAAGVSGADSAAAVRVNGLGTRNILESLKSLRHFIYISSFHVYGRSSGMIDEECAPEPTNDYGISKLLGEDYVRQSSAAAGTAYTILRLTNGYGCPNQTEGPAWKLIFNDLAKMALAEERLTLRSPASTRRDFIWLGDACDAIAKLLEAKPANDVFNLSRGKSATSGKIAEAIAEAYQIRFGRALTVEAPKEIAPTPMLEVSSEKLRQQIEFEPRDEFLSTAIEIFDFLTAAADKK